MFTGIVEAVGRIAQCDRAADGVRIRIDAQALDLSGVAVGDSIAVAGCCLTVVAVAPPLLDFDVSGETLRCTAGFERGPEVNLERALRLSDRLGGHLMSGHVDGVGVVATFAPVASGTPANWRLEIDAPAALAPLIAPKGSIAIDGVSLTTNTIEGARLGVNLIPHTLAATTLGKLIAGTRVNLEVDLIARYAARLVAASAGAQSS